MSKGLIKLILLGTLIQESLYAQTSTEKLKNELIDFEIQESEEENKIINNENSENKKLSENELVDFEIQVDKNEENKKVTRILDKSQIAKKEQEIKVLKKTEEDLRVKIHKCERESEAIKKELTSEKTKKQELGKEVGNLEKIIKSLKQKAGKKPLKEIDYEELMRKNQLEIKKATEVNSTLKIKIEKTTQELEKISKQLKDLKNSEKENVKDKEILENQNKQQGSQIEKQKAKEKEQIKKIDSLGKENKIKNEEIVKLKKDREENKLNIKTLKSTNDDLKTIIKDKESKIKNIIEEKASIEKTLKEKIESKNEEISKLNANINKKENEIKKILEEKAEIKAQIVILKKEAYILQNEIKEAKEKQKHMKEVIIHLENKRDELFKALKTKEFSNKSLINDIEKMKKENKALEKKVENVKQQRAEEKVSEDIRIKSLKANINALEEEFEKFGAKKYKKIELKALEILSEENIKHLEEANEPFSGERIEVQKRAASSKYTNTQALERLAHSKSFYVRNNIAKNKNINSSTMRYLAQDEVAVVKLSLIKNPNITIDVLKILTEDLDKEIRKKAQSKIEELKR